MGKKLKSMKKKRQEFQRGKKVVHKKKRNYILLHDSWVISFYIVVIL